MKLLAFLLKKDRKLRRRRDFVVERQNTFTQIGREQFKKLADRGLDIPVAYL